MAGHSKWKQIKRKKAITDAKRGASWTKVIREITVAAKAGGGDPGGNPRLRTAIDAAKAVNMPGDNIERAIKKGTGELEGAIYEEVTYEGYGPGGAAIIIEATTDNSTRPVADIRHAFSRNGGNLGSSNSVAWMFDRKSQVIIEKEQATEEQLMDIALEAGADDVKDEGDSRELLSAPESHNAMVGARVKAKIPTVSAEISMIPKNPMALDQKHVSGMLKMLDAMEEHDDVQNVWSNFDYDEEGVAAQ